MLRVLGLSLLLAGAAAPARAFSLWLGPREKSRWLPAPIDIDGDASDWKDLQLDDDEGFSFAFANDDKDLYLLFAPHTKGTRAQLSGRDGQSVSLRFDPAGKRSPTISLTLLPPEPGRAERTLKVAGVDASAVAMAVGDVDARGALEARVALSAFGSPPPKAISVELQTSEPTRAAPGGPAPRRAPSEEPEAPAGRHGRMRRPPPVEEPPSTWFWIRVTLARPPKP